MIRDFNEDDDIFLRVSVKRLDILMQDPETFFPRVFYTNSKNRQHFVFGQEKNFIKCIYEIYVALQPVERKLDHVVSSAISSIWQKSNCEIILSLIYRQKVYRLEKTSKKSIVTSKYGKGTVCNFAKCDASARFISFSIQRLTSLKHIGRRIRLW